MVDSNVAFVQTPQTYGNMHNIISRGAGYMQSMFYRFIQPGRTHFNAAFCRHHRVVPAVRGASTSAHVHAVEVRGRLDVADVARTRVEVDLHSADAGGG